MKTWMLLGLLTAACAGCDDADDGDSGAAGEVEEGRLNGEPCTEAAQCRGGRCRVAAQCEVPGVGTGACCANGVATGACIDGICTNGSDLGGPCSDEFGVCAELAAAFGEPCAAASDCASNLCLSTGGVSICTQRCDPECPAGFECTLAQDGSVCIPQ